jgi:hypothetical protein
VAEIKFDDIYRLFSKNIKGIAWHFI